ncbi:MAG: ankyrin repeat domain-containing protein [Cyanobacteria bacterium SBLK]|nr:ankyrin repeat domain-containing protein [Cyanobacteria bacterium SBLK]
MSQVSVRDRIDPILENWLQVRGFDANNLEQPGENGDTALMQATREGELETARSLIRAGALLNARNNDGNNALWFACFRDRYDLIELLVEAGINCDNQNDNGATALMYASSAGKTEMVRALLAMNADAKLKNLDDFQAIDFAANFNIIKILKNVTV